MKKFKKRQTHLIFMSILSVFLITGCGGSGGGGHWDEPVPVDLVSATVPVDGAVGVPIGNRLTVTFTEAMDPATINTTTFTVKQGAAPVSGTVAYSGVTAVFTPASNLAPLTTYTATITAGAKNLDGNPLAKDYVWMFTTGAAPDTTAPTVTFTDPADLDVGVAINKKISATFSETMDPLTMNTTTFTLAGPTAVSGTVTYSGQTAVFTPATALAFSTTYTATITTGATDLGGNALASNYVWTFTTGAAPDTTAPNVTGTDPADLATGVATNKKIAATFTEAMDPLTISTATFTLAGAAAVSGTVTYSGLTAVFTPATPLAFSTTYTATITTGATDLASNALASNYVWTFTTGAAPDTTAPTVTFTDPADLDVGVETNKKIAATFSEAMDPLTISTASFTVTGPGVTPVAGTVIYVGDIATFTPASNLAGNTTFTATITTEATDLAGNALASNYVWTFTTGAAPDVTAPTVTLTNPADLDVGVCMNKTINATFSESMDPLTLNIATYTLQATGPPLGPVLAGTVSYDPVTNVATLTPSADLAANTSYTATITTGAEDLAGNALAVNEVWSFTTGATICAEPVALGAAQPFGGFGGGAGVTNQGTLTIVNGDLGTTGVSTTVTGFQDSVGDVYTITPLNDGMVNGRIYTDAPPPGGAGVGGTAVTMAVATAAAADALIAFNNLSPGSLPGGADIGNNLGGLTVAPGIYLAPGAGDYLLTVSDLTLDGQGDANAVWIFQAPASLTIGAPGFPRSITLINGAQAKNVYWYVGSAARIEDQSSMVGTIIASAGVTISTAGQLATTTLNGRALGLYASVTMVNTIVNVPLP